MAEHMKYVPIMNVLKDRYYSKVKKLQKAKYRLKLLNFLNWSVYITQKVKKYV